MSEGLLALLRALSPRALLTVAVCIMLLTVPACGDSESPDCDSENPPEECSPGV